MTQITGWGRGAYGEAAWGTPLPVIVTGFSIASALGTVSISGDANITLTGVSGTGSVNSVSVSGDANIQVMGPSAIMSQGIVIATAWSPIPDDGSSWSSISGSAGTWSGITGASNTWNIAA